MRQLIDMDELWEGAIEAADARLQEYVDRLPRTLLERSPLSFDEITAKAVDWDGLILRLGRSETS